MRFACHAFEELFVMEPSPSKNDNEETGSGDCPTNEKSPKDVRSGFLYRSNVSLVPEGGVDIRGGLDFVAVFVVGFDLRGRHGHRLRQHHFQNLSSTQQHIRNYYTPLRENPKPRLYV